MKHQFKAPAEGTRRVGVRWPNAHVLLDVALAAAVVILSLLLRPGLAQFADSGYQQFLRLQWVLTAGGKGLELDWLSLPLPPLLHLGLAGVVGPELAERWLPVALSVAIVMVITRVLLRGYPLAAKLMAVTPLLATPFFYLLQQQLDLQLFVLLLGLQIATLRRFQERPTVPRVTAAIGINVLLSLTNYAALVAIASAALYLVFVANHNRAVLGTAWRALLWMYVPFSLSGYALWAVCWLVAGSRLKTSYFIGSGSGNPDHLAGFLSAIGSVLALPLPLLLGLALVLLVSRRISAPGMRTGRSHTATPAVLAFMLTGVGLLSLQAAFAWLPVNPQTLIYALILLVPLALASVYRQARDFLASTRPSLRMALWVLMFAVMVIFPLQFVVGPVAVGQGLPSTSAQGAPGRALENFQAADPGGRVLLDPRFTANFVVSSGIDPDRLLTPFDQGFERWVTDPPADVHTVVVTDATDDRVGDNYPALRLRNVLPDATLLAKGPSAGTSVRAFLRQPFALPGRDLARASVEPYAAAEEELLAEVLRRLGDEGLPKRPDGWAYAVDMGNLLIYAAERGDARLLARVDETVRRYYLTASLEDPSALYTIAWRARADRPAEASGTTESLRFIEGYLLAAERWNVHQPVRLAQAIAQSYTAHEQPAEAHARWFIRNYYNYDTRQYATNTFTVDYYPDVLYRLAERTGDADLRRVADESAAFLRDAQHPSGLYYEMYQPEVKTIYPQLEFFSPNDISKTHDATEVSLGMVGSNPDVARKTLAFTRSQYPGLYSEYSVTSMAGDKYPPSIALHAGVVRLAVALDDAEFARRVLDDRMLLGMEQLRQRPADEAWFFDAITTLLTLREYQESVAGPVDPSNQAHLPRDLSVH